MSNPREILSRMQRRQARAAALRPRSDARVPAPAPVGVAPSPQSPAAPPVEPARPAPIPAAPARPTTARPAGSHALYSQVMRSHDRMGTRHI